jgi:(p)ppGpp synthase/HD superfamily hydrolase
MNIVAQADEFAALAHGTIRQVRRYSGEPYINHPRGVARLVSNTPGVTTEMIAASLLHDVVKHTKHTLDDVRYLFGSGVAHLVDGLTDKANLAMGNRAVRKHYEANRIAQLDGEIQTIKVADSIDNLESIIRHDPSFARVALAEKRDLLDRLVRADQNLLERAYVLIEMGWRTLAGV